MNSRDKNLLYPPFALLLAEFELRLAEAGLPFRLFEGLRTWDKQDELYWQGRTKPGARVTNARGGDSWHNYGLAADYVLDGQPEKPGLQWSWETRADFDHSGTSDWRQMGELAESIGLEWGGRWRRFPDLPHVEKRYGLILADAKELWSEGGIKRVWEECSKI